jgi:cobalamin biosynthesis protein CobD/CbiB
MMMLEVFNQFPEDFSILKTLISAFVAFALGVMWYHPVVVGEKAAQAISKQTNDFKPTAIVYVLGLLLWIITSSIYSFMVNFLTPPSMTAMLGLSTFLWVGFILPPLLLNGLYSGRKLLVIGIDSTYFLAGLYLFAVIHDVM